jgi:hypothetical protein
MSKWGRAVVGLAALFAVACASNPGPPPLPPGEEAKVAVEQRMAGTWRLTSYVPNEPLSQVMLMGIQSDQVVVRFENGRVRSATSALQFDRRFRVADVMAETFRVLIADDQGLEYESWCQFDSTGKLLFESRTDPWKGRGTLERQGGPTPPGPPR